MNLRNFFDLGSEEPPRSKTDRVAESLSEVSLFRQDTESKAHARDERRVNENIGYAEDAGVLGGPPTPDRSVGPVEDADLVHSPANGRFADDPLATDAPGVDRRRDSGRYIDEPQADTDIGRNTETGRFVDRGDR
jgi:hypothetical protein